MVNSLYSIVTTRFVELDPLRGIDKSGVRYNNYAVVSDSVSNAVEKALKHSNRGFAKGWELHFSEMLKPGDRLPNPDQLVFLN